MKDNGKRRTKPFRVRKSRIHGNGVFAVRRIRKGQRVVEYIGKRITQATADRLYGNNGNKHHHTLLFAIDNKVVIDAGQGGGPARFINHSCEPNCEAVNEDGRIFIEAIRNIQPGVELTYDYQFEAEETPEEAFELYPCRCGSPTCRKTIVKP